MNRVFHFANNGIIVSTDPLKPGLTCSSRCEARGGRRRPPVPPPTRVGGPSPARTVNRRYRPTQRGARFSMNAVRPSL